METNLTVTEWLASQYDANLFDGCERAEDVENVIANVIAEGYEDEFADWMEEQEITEDELKSRAVAFVKERETLD